jgi:dUTP pyrophosphatase
MRVDVSIVLAESAAGDPTFLPHYASADAAGADLRAAVPQTIRLDPGQRALVPSGVKIALPVGYEAQVRARSGLALRSGIYLPNGPGTIDADYRGEIGVIVQNGGDQPFEIVRGERIAQLVVAPVAQARFQRVATLGESGRGEDGFGSTGGS